jgi:hypothetical protein
MFGISSRDGSVRVYDGFSDAITQIDAASGTVVRVIPVIDGGSSWGGDPGIDAADGLMWMAGGSSPQPHRAIGGLGTEACRATETRLVRDHVLLRSSLDLLRLRGHDRGIQTVQRARHLFREHFPATPAPMSHLRIPGGIPQPSWERSPGSGPAERSQRETPGQCHDQNKCTLHGPSSRSRHRLSHACQGSGEGATNP